LIVYNRMESRGNRVMILVLAKSPGAV